MTLQADLGPISFALKYSAIFYGLLFFAIVVIAAIWWLLPIWYGRRSSPKNLKRRRDAETQLRSNLSIFFSGGVIALGIIGVIIQFQANIERDHRQQRLTLSAENVKRFNESVTQLEKTPLAALGAISTLSELAKQDGFYWAAISEVHEFLRQAILKGGDINRAEIRNAFRVLSERDLDTWRNRSTEPSPLDFTTLDLGRLKFSRLRLEGSDFGYTNFSDARLPGADFAGADFRCANFENSHLDPSYLYENTNPTALGPKLEKVNFRNSFLYDVKFRPGNDDNDKSYVLQLTDACFEGAHLDGADISHMDVTNVSGLTRDQINQAKFPPNNLNDFTFKPCKPFKDLCPTTPGTR